MAHNLSFDAVTREYEMTYIDESPWHGLGQRLKNGDRFDLEAALTAGHLDWTVNAEPLYTLTDHNATQTDMHYQGRIRRAPAQAIARTDTNEILGIVGTRYTPIQHTDVFRAFAPLVSSKALSVNTAGSLGGGSKAWMLMRIESETETIIRPQTATRTLPDIVKPFVLVSASHDGSEVVTVCPTAIRVVCANTLALTDRDRREARIRIRHTSSAPVQLAQLDDAIAASVAVYRTATEHMRHLAECPAQTADAYEYLDELLPAPERPDVSETQVTTRVWDAWRREYSRWTVRRQTAIQLWTSGKGAEACTLWDAYNAVTEMIDHTMILPVTKAGKTNATDTRRASAQLSAIAGDGDALRHQAWDLIRQRAGLLVAA